MKKTALFLAGCLFFFCFVSFSVLAQTIDIVMGNEIKVFMEDEQLSFRSAPFIQDGRVMVPMRTILEALGATVEWDGATRTITSRRADTTAVLTLDSLSAKVNENVVTLDAPACMVNEVTFVPLRFFSTTFGAEAVWDGEAKTVRITRPSTIETLTIIPEELSLKSGQDFTLTVKAKHSDGSEEVIAVDQVKWQTTNSNVASVTDGAVSASGTGTAVIMAGYQGKTAILNIKVDELLTGISLSPVNVVLQVGEKKDLTVEARYKEGVQQALDSEKVTWVTTNSRVATVTDGNVVAVSSGTVTITARYNDYTATAIVEVFSDMPIEFNDLELLAAIRAQLGKASGSIYRSELAGLTGLVAEDRLIEDLSGLEYCTGLTSLSLNNNHIRDLSPLASLTNLRRLELGYNQVRDLSPLASLTNLTRLSVNNNQVVDISPLSSLTDITWLSLGTNQITNISSLSTMEELATLNISGNNITSLSSLSELSSLSTLLMWSNQVSSLAPLADLSNLTVLSAWSNNISDISLLDDLPNLAWLVIGDNPLDLSNGSATMTLLRKLRSKGIYVRTESF